MSVGVAVAELVSTHDVSVPELLATADCGLYQAKSQGREQVGLVAHPGRRVPAVASRR